MRLALAALPLACGCAGFWDDVTSRDFTFDSLFNKPNPMVVLRDSPDGDKRAKALQALREPSQNGGTDADQDAVVKILIAAATADKQPLCRLAAIESLSHFKDPRAVPGLKEAFYNANSFLPDTATVVRCRALAALGETGSPDAMELLVRVVKEPQAEGSETDKQQALDVRIAAARALSHYNQQPALTALVQVLRTEKDVALRDRAHEALQTATGRYLAADDKAWEDVTKPGGVQNLAGAPEQPPIHERVRGLVDVLTTNW
jgi:HEAT repeat protein